MLNDPVPLAIASVSVGGHLAQTRPNPITFPENLEIQMILKSNMFLDGRDVNLSAFFFLALWTKDSERQVDFR